MLNRLAKWRTLFAGWQLGSRPKGDPECDAVRNHRETTLLLRAEMSALTALCIKRRVFTQQEWDEMVGMSAEELCGLLEERFPGVRADDQGLVFDARATETMKGWKQ